MLQYQYEVINIEVKFFLLFLAHFLNIFLFCEFQILEPTFSCSYIICNFSFERIRDSTKTLINKPVIVQRVCCVHQSKIAMARYALPEMSIMSKCQILIDLIFNYNTSHDKEKVFYCIFKCISVRY